MLSWLALLLFVAGTRAHAADTTDVPLALDSAHYTLWTDAGLPGPTADWQPTRLPFISSSAGLMTPDNFPENAAVWFRLTPERPVSEEPVSLLFLRYQLALTV